MLKRFSHLRRYILFCIKSIQLWNELSFVVGWWKNTYGGNCLHSVCTVRKFTLWRYCLALYDEIFDHFPLFTSHRALQLHHPSHTAKSAKTLLTVQRAVRDNLFWLLHWWNKNDLYSKSSCSPWSVSESCKKVMLAKSGENGRKLRKSNESGSVLYIPYSKPKQIKCDLFCCQVYILMWSKFSPPRLLFLHLWHSAQTLAMR